MFGSLLFKEFPDLHIDAEAETLLKNLDALQDEYEQLALRRRQAERALRSHLERSGALADEELDGDDFDAVLEDAKFKAEWPEFHQELAEFQAAEEQAEEEEEEEDDEGDEEEEADEGEEEAEAEAAELYEQFKEGAEFEEEADDQDEEYVPEEPEQ